MIMLTLTGQYVGWESVFYVFGSLGVLWFLAWSLLVFDGPDVHPRISYDEREYLQSFLNDSQEEKPRSIPWKQIATSAPVWAITATHVTQNFGNYNVITNRSI